MAATSLFGCARAPAPRPREVPPANAQRVTFPAGLSLDAGWADLHRDRSLTEGSDDLEIIW